MWVISVWSHPVIQIHDGKSVGNIIMRQSVAWNWYAVPSHYQSSAGDPIEKSLEFNFKWETKKLKISVRIKSPERNGPDGCIQLDTDSSSPLERCPCQDTTAGELFIYFINVERWRRFSKEWRFYFAIQWVCFINVINYRCPLWQLHYDDLNWFAIKYLLIAEANCEFVSRKLRIAILA